MSEPRPNEIHAEAMLAESVDDTGLGAVVKVSFEYDPLDPFAVRVVFGNEPEANAWVFARDLLIDGFYEPSGMGDVQVFPCISVSGSAVVVIELASHDGEVMVQVDARDVERFIRAMVRLVPVGSESCGPDLALQLLQILGQSDEVDLHD